jgi:ABC-2 type transport system ATP-binding protein
MGEPLFKLRNVTKIFGKNVVLSNVSLDVRPGEIFGIIGASGSGKTTLLNTIVGFNPSDKGDVLFRTMTKGVTSYHSVFKRRLRVKRLYGFTSQLPSFYPKLTAAENLSYFGSLYGLSPVAIRKNTDALLDLMDLSPARDILAENLSGGMERRLDIACALVHNPDVLILDEPTADLDPSLRDHINRLIVAINKRGTTVIIASHHLEDMERIASRVALLAKGSVLDVGTPDELRRKHTKEAKIVLESYPGEYKAVLSRLKTKNITTAISGTVLVIKVKNVQGVLSELMAALTQEKEAVLSLKVIEPNLEDVFLALQ